LLGRIVCWSITAGRAASLLRLLPRARATVPASARPFRRRSPAARSNRRATMARRAFLLAAAFSVRRAPPALGLGRRPRPTPRACRTT
jgi:hypothetical protein